MAIHSVFQRPKKGRHLAQDFVLAGKAETVFRLIELMAMGEKIEKQQKTKRVKGQKWHFGKWN